MKESVEKQEKKGEMEKYFFRASAEDFKKIPGSPIAYWVSEKVRNVFDNYPSLENYGKIQQGLITGNNDEFLRNWNEVQLGGVEFNCSSRTEASLTGKKWFPYKKGGEFRKWYGNLDFIVNWLDDGRQIRNLKNANGKLLSRPQNMESYFMSGATWSRTSSSNFGARLLPKGVIFDGESPTFFSNNTTLILAFLCSKMCLKWMKLLNPTLHFQIGDIKKLSLINDMNVSKVKRLSNNTKHLISLSKVDWNSYETSWDFFVLPLLHSDYYQSTLNATYQNLRTHWQEMTLEMQRFEEENNRIFIEAYGLQDELTPEVLLNEITLTGNPHYRYKLSGQWLEASAQEQETELERRLRQDTIKEFLSYAVGCMFGRYSLDAPCLILANQGENVEDYFRIVQEKRKRPEVVSVQSSVISKDNTDAGTENCQLTTDNFQNAFPPDEDNVIPILDGEWFIDDITERFGAFLKTTFGTEHYEENLKFITDALGKDIRKYFLKDFYKDHLRTYKKRPIYWLFSSPKGSFNALIYMHRYRPDTVSVILNDYLREFRTKLQNAQENLEQLSISADATKTEKTKALKQIEKLKKTIIELDTYENETLYPLATQNIKIDLDDGVKVNYKKFGKALKKIPGLS